MAASSAVGPEQPAVYAQRSAGYGTLALIAAALDDGRTTALVRTASTLRAIDVAMLTSDADTWMWSEELASQRCNASDAPRTGAEMVRAASDKAVYALTASAGDDAPVLRAIVGQASEPLPPRAHARAHPPPLPADGFGALGRGARQRLHVRRLARRLARLRPRAHAPRRDHDWQLLGAPHAARV